MPELRVTGQRTLASNTLRAISELLGARYTSGAEYPVVLPVDSSSPVVSNKCGSNLEWDRAGEVAELLTREDILYLIERIANGEVNYNPTPARP